MVNSIAAIKRINGGAAHWFVVPVTRAQKMIVWFATGCRTDHLLLAYQLEIKK